MKKIRVKYRRKVVLWQDCHSVVEANTEEEAISAISKQGEAVLLDDRDIKNEKHIRVLENDFTNVESEETAFIALFSGGRDSSAMTDLICEQKLPLDYIIFSDTNAEFTMMYDYIAKFGKYLEDRYDRQIEILTPRDTFESWVFGKMTKGKQKGMIRGLPKMIDPCFWKRESKVRPVERFCKDKGIINPIKYIGYTNSEKERADVKDLFMRFPLIDAKMCEADVDKRLELIGMVNVLYEFFSRTGCSFCPYMSLKAFYTVYINFPEVWEYMKSIEQKLQLLDNVVNDRWSIEMTMLELEEKFSTGNHNYDDVPVKACECKI